MWFTLSITIIVIGLIIYRMLFRRRVKATLFRLYSYLWIFICILGILNPLNYYIISDKFQCELFAGLASWIIAFLLVGSFYTIHNNAVDTKTSGKLFVRKIVMYVYMIFLLAILIIIVNRILALVRRGFTYTNIHSIAFGDIEDESLFSDSTMNKLYSLGFYGIILSLLPVLVIKLIDREFTIPYIIIGIIILIYCSVLGRRFPLMYLGLYLLLYMPFSGIAIPKKLFRRVVVICLILFAITFLFTAFRKKAFETGDFRPVYETFLSYFNLCLPIGDYWLNLIDNAYGNTDLPMLGYSFFKGVLRVARIFLRPLGLILTNDNLDQIINYPQMSYIRISSTATSNAFATFVYFFHLDGGIIGVIIESSIFGALTSIIENSTFKRPSKYKIAFYLLYAQAVLKSFVRWEFNDAAYVIAFLFLLVLIDSKKVTAKT